MKLKYKKSFVFISIYLLVNILFSALLFLNFKNQANMVKEISRNMIAIQDFNTLKTALSPLLLSEMKSIKIFHKGRVIFELGQSTKIDQLNSFSETVEMGANNTYAVLVQFSLFQYLLIYLLNIGFSYLIYFYYFNFKNKLDLKMHLAHLSQKLAHDIRTPISTLNLISSRIADAEIKQLQLSVVKQINEIANELLNQSKSDKTIDRYSDSAQNQDVSRSTKLIELLLNLEKEYGFKSIALKQKINFNLNVDLLSSCAVEDELIKVIYPIINNLIQNSIDATIDNDVIDVSILVKNQKLYLIVKDNGKAMPNSVLEQIGKKPISFGKQDSLNYNKIVSGNGIALYNAKKDLARFNAGLSVESKLGVGTTVSITLPFVEK